MCLILVAWKVHADYPLIVAANRDEFHERPAAAADWWPDRPWLLAGRDLQAGGTWLGVTRGGQIAALTNYRDPSRIKPDALSRGELVVRMLETGHVVPERLMQLKELHHQYNDFNLIVADGGQLGVFESVSGEARILEPGIYGLSNHLLDTPWPKIQRAKSKLTAALGALPADHMLLELLRDDQAAPDDQLPRTGVSLEWERLLSSAFIRGSRYGTRCSTVVQIGTDGEVRFHEWTWTADGSLGGEVEYRFQSQAR